VALMKNQSLDLSRRKLLLGALQATGLVLFSGCEKMFLTACNKTGSFSHSSNRLRAQTDAYKNF